MASDAEQHDEEALRGLLRSISPDTDPPPGCQERLRLRLMGRIRAQQSALARRTGGWRKHVRVWGLRAAPAAVAMILVAFVTWWLAGGGVRTASADFSEMLARVRQASTVAYDQILRIPGQPETKVRVLMSRPGRTRVTWPHGRVTIIDQTQGAYFTLSPDTKKATLVRVATVTTSSDPLDSLRRAEVSAGRFVRKEIVNNREVAVYEVAQPQGIMRVSVDHQQELPIRIEVRCPTRHGQDAVTVLEDFTWNQPIPDSLFSFDVPPGYTLVKPQSEPSEGSLVDLLRACAQMRGGSFPEELDSRSVLELLLKSYPEDGGTRIDASVAPTVTDIDDEAKETYIACLRGLAFVEQVSENGSWQYVGKGVRLGDGTAEVCWWRLPGATSIRVVYGDLQVKDVRAEGLPLPARPPASNPTDNGSLRK